MNNSKQISILGCGWLGIPLAKHFIALGYKVKGSVRREKKIDELKQAEIQAYLLNIGSNKIEGKITDFLKSSDVLIICIPPGLRKQPNESFVDKIKNLLPFIAQSAIKKVLFISSTSVYANDKSIVTENTIPSPETVSGKQLLATEQLLKKNAHFQTTILRFGGLIGPGRHPVKTIAGRTGLKNPKAPVNLIHLEDCIGIIQRIIEQEQWAQIFNAAAPYHPSKETYYTEIASNRGMSTPLFDNQSPSKGKYIDSHKILDNLKYNFKKSDLAE